MIVLNKKKERLGFCFAFQNLYCKGVIHYAKFLLNYLITEPRVDT